MGFDVHGALAAGYTPDEVEAYLLQRSQPWAQPAPPPAAPSFGPPSAAPVRPAPAPAPAPMTDARAIVREQRDAAMGMPTQQTLNDAITGTPLYQPFVPRSLADLADPEMMPVAGSPVGEGGGLSLADMVPRSKWDMAIGLAGVLPGGKIIRGIKGRIPDLHSLINERNTVYHATSPAGMKEILDSGEIAASAPKEQPSGLLEGWGGVSVSRNPRVASKAEKAISFEIDASRMPKHEPFVAQGYGKTISTESGERSFAHGFKPWGEFAPKNVQERFIELNRTDPDAASRLAEPYRRMAEEHNRGLDWQTYQGQNPRYESESRTFEQSIPLSAVKRALIDRSALPEGYDVAGLVKTLADRGISAEIKEGGREMHSARVRK